MLVAIIGLRVLLQGSWAKVQRGTLAIDTTVVSTLRSDATPEEGSSTPVAPPSCSQEGRQNSLSCKIGGADGPKRHIKSREALPLQGGVKVVWLHKWSCLLGCIAAWSFALSLVNGLAPGVNGPTPSVNDVLWDMLHM